MEDAIVRKLRILLQKGVASEADALYLLVETRKLMDLRETADGQYELLKLYCDWVAHPILCGPTAQKIVRRVDEIYPKVLDGRLEEGEWLYFRGLFNFGNFRGELTQFLDQYGLRPFSDGDWNRFLGFFIGVIGDCPLRCKAENANLKNVDEVVLVPRVGGSLAGPDETPELNWALYHRGEPRLPIRNKPRLSQSKFDSTVQFDRRRGSE